MRPACLTSALLLIAACGGGTPAPGDIVLRSGTGADIGRVSLQEKDAAVWIRVRASGLTPGMHGVHLHAAAKCEGPAFQSAGGHLNPAAKQHGHQNPAGPHQGDLGNLSTGSDGRADATLTLPGTTLRALLGSAGISLVVHAAADDDKTDPSGNSGARVACAVLQ